MISRATNSETSSRRRRGPACPPSRTAGARSTRRGRGRSRAGRRARAARPRSPIAEDQDLEEEREVVGGHAAAEHGPAAARRSRSGRTAASAPTRPARESGGRRARARPWGEGLGEQHDEAGERATMSAGTSGRRSSVRAHRAPPAARLDGRRRACGADAAARRATLRHADRSARRARCVRVKSGLATPMKRASATSGHEHRRPRAAERSGRARFFGFVTSP